jgi:hypothetical protein
VPSSPRTTDGRIHWNKQQVHNTKFIFCVWLSIHYYATLRYSISFTAVFLYMYTTSLSYQFGSSSQVTLAKENLLFTNKHTQFWVQKLFLLKSLAISDLTNWLANNKQILCLFTNLITISQHHATVSCPEPNVGSSNSKTSFTCLTHFTLHHPIMFTIWWRLQTPQLLTVQLSPSPCHFRFLRSKYAYQHPDLQHFQSLSYLKCERQVPHHT